MHLVRGMVSCNVHDHSGIFTDNLWLGKCWEHTAFCNVLRFSDKPTRPESLCSHACNTQKLLIKTTVCYELLRPIKTLSSKLIAPSA